MIGVDKGFFMKYNFFKRGNMVKKAIERRKHRRVFFTMKEGITTTVTIAGRESEEISATLLSIGGGGISFAIPRVRAQEIKQGDILIIQSVKGIEALSSFTKLNVLVKYIIDYDVYIYISFGCEFLEMNNSQNKILKNYIDVRLKNLENQVI